MNTQLLQYARLELATALMDLSGGTKGQLEAFSEHPPADKNHYPRQHIHKVQLEGNKQVRSERAPTYALETRSRIRPAPPMKEFEFASCAWRRAVNTLPVYQSSWIRYCYGFDLKFEHQKNICEAIWMEYQKNLPPGLLTKTKKRLISLVWLAVQDVAAKNKNESYKEYAGSALATLMTVSRSTWCEVYSHHWQGLKLAVSELDNDSLIRVLRSKEALCFEEVIE
ncbi:antitermination Q family protein (plasmid) [Rahnella aceris]|uniref:Antitermination Q family protein n=1 Tax=Rahnella sp. (strain Y9602) TaxID=2703885 RepID=A0A0H3FNU2_RAHSY|nr:bacteriophage antitermination protein Q [Rahnella aceris]ADW76558.1 antitermination Q family protein [Rahnella aceris]